ncbi:hypothetical protein VN97_g6500 [Penicillium thymicola]|uniref:Solid-state culture expressed protein (Aos23) n=1 Tax=Penicillium thymicola TaxID=293382 RepID=A0AAI9TGT9_PENTH|nr:hypothetical protein VN97_g6500 [Penicillium thymicola]
METVNKYVNAASTVIWGGDNSPQAQQHGEEPISGVQGKGRATDPYDAGNRDEQPGAIQSNINTAPQHPIIDNKPQEKEVTSITTPRAPTSISACTSVTPALSISGDPTEASESKENKSISGGYTESSGRKDDNDSGYNQEQRSTSTSQAKGGESSEAPRPAHSKEVSKEALQGPQVSAPSPAEDFEKEFRGKKPVDKEDDIGKSSSGESNGNSNESPLSNKSESSSHGNGKQGSMSKVKESVKKHIHYSSK